MDSELNKLYLIMPVLSSSILSSIYLILSFILLFISFTVLLLPINIALSNCFIEKSFKLLTVRMMKHAR